MLHHDVIQCINLMNDVWENEQSNNINKEAARNNNTFFEANNQYLFPMIIAYDISKKLKDVELSVEFSNDVIKKLRDYIKYAQDSFEQKSVIYPGQYTLPLKKAYEKMSNEWENIISNLLKDRIEKLSTIKLLWEDDISNILKCLNNFSSWPVNVKKYDDFINNYKHSTDTISEIKLEDDEVYCFLEKIKDKQATLEDLSENIVKWIKDNDLAGRIMLKI